MKLLIQKQKTKKLFYNQYAFKVATLIRGGGYIRNWGADRVLLWNNDGPLKHWYKLSDHDIDCLKEYTNKLRPLLVDGVKVRYEGSHVNLFVKNRTQFDLIVNALEDYVCATWEPENDQEMAAMEGNSKVVIVNEYPYGCYTFKAILRNLPEERRQSLISWIDKYPEDEFKVSKTTRLYLEGKKFWKQDPFILVKEPKMMTMLALHLGTSIRRTEQYVLRSSINTGS